MQEENEKEPDHPFRHEDRSEKTHVIAESGKRSAAADRNTTYVVHVVSGTRCLLKIISGAVFCICQIAGRSDFFTDSIVTSL